MKIYVIQLATDRIKIQCDDHDIKTVGDGTLVVAFKMVAETVATFPLKMIGGFWLETAQVSVKVP